MTLANAKEWMDYLHGRCWIFKEAIDVPTEAGAMKKKAGNKIAYYFI